MTTFGFLYESNDRMREGHKVENAENGSPACATGPPPPASPREGARGLTGSGESYDSPELSESPTAPTKWRKSDDEVMMREIHYHAGSGQQDPPCVHLLDSFGAEYRIAFDPAYDAYHVPKAKLDPWMMTIPCKYGTIYPHGQDWLALECDHHPAARRKLEALGLAHPQDGTGEHTFVFPVNRWDEVAAIVQPKRRKRLSAEQRQACAERLRGYQFHAARKSENERHQQAQAESNAESGPGEGMMPSGPSGFEQDVHGDMRDAIGRSLVVTGALSRGGRRMPAR